MSGIPLGFRFMPTEAELIHYLWTKVVDLPLPFPGVVIERDLYGDKAPWEVFNNEVPNPWGSDFVLCRVMRDDSKCLRRYEVPSASTDRATESEPCAVERSQEYGKRRPTFEEENSRRTKVRCGSDITKISIELYSAVIPVASSPALQPNWLDDFETCCGSVAPPKSNELDSTNMSIPSTAEEVASLPSWFDDENIFENFDDQTFQSFLNDQFQF
ncbi:hypothetical protein F0562_030711 [Nyssa sinensis]|uniref:NAC domain-containing protein n=1 Tax=Nyssa sinensis TaxID=561372 RepID=A0A5J5AZL1_9ASTE|nr:hypothetical protein F0562_030711 [Nyssa sinensis]